MDKEKMNELELNTPDKEAEKMFTLARKAYSDSEIRRVPVHFYTVAEKATPIKATL